MPNFMWYFATIFKNWKKKKVYEGERDYTVDWNSQLLVAKSAATCPQIQTCSQGPFLDLLSSNSLTRFMQSGKMCPHCQKLPGGYLHEAGSGASKWEASNRRHSSLISCPAASAQVTHKDAFLSFGLQKGIPSTWNEIRTAEYI